MASRSQNDLVYIHLFVSVLETSELERSPWWQMDQFFARPLQWLCTARMTNNSITGFAWLCGPGTHSYLSRQGKIARYIQKALGFGLFKFSLARALSQPMLFKDQSFVHTVMFVEQCIAMELLSLARSFIPCVCISFTVLHMLTA